MAPKDIASFRLITPFHDHKKHTLHIRNGRDSNGGQVQFEEKWKSQKDRIGVGTYGTVWLQKKVTSMSWASKNSQLRAVKELDKGRIPESIDYRRELQALIEFSQVKHNYRDTFVQFLGWFESSESIYIVMEYLPLRGLDHYIENAISEDGTKQIAMQVLTGLQYMHEAGYTHRDIKPANILVVAKQPESPKWHIKLADFGGSKKVRNNETALRTIFGTPAYQAPEFTPDYLLDLDYNPDQELRTSALDIWSLGCVIYHIMALSPPFPDSPMIYCRENGKNFPCGPFDNSTAARTSEMCIDFIKKTLRPLPSERPTAKTALQDTWFADLARISNYLSGPASLGSAESSYQTAQPYAESIAISESSNNSVSQLIPNLTRQNSKPQEPEKYNQLAHRRPPRNQYLHRTPPNPRET